MMRSNFAHKQSHTEASSLCACILPTHSAAWSESKKQSQKIILIIRYQEVLLSGRYFTAAGAVHLQIIPSHPILPYQTSISKYRTTMQCAVCPKDTQVTQGLSPCASTTFFFDSFLFLTGDINKIHKYAYVTMSGLDQLTRFYTSHTFELTGKHFNTNSICF